MKDEATGQVRPKMGDSSLAWAWRPDHATTSALARGANKIKDARPPTGVIVERKAAERALARMERESKKRRTRKGDSKVATKVSSKKKTGKTSRAQALKKKASAKKRTASSKKTPQRVEASSEGMIPLKKICQDLDLDPKATRVKLRRAIAKGEIDFHEHSSRWEFDKEQAKQIRKLLSAGAGA